MANVRLSINPKLLEKLHSETNIQNTQLVAEALTLLEWAVSEAKEGRYLVTTDEKGENVKKVSLPSLDAAFETKDLKERLKSKFNDFVDSVSEKFQGGKEEGKGAQSWKGRVTSEDDESMP